MASVGLLETFITPKGCQRHLIVSYIQKILANLVSLHFHLKWTALLELLWKKHELLIDADKLSSPFSCCALHCSRTFNQCLNMWHNYANNQRCRYTGHVISLQFMIHMQHVREHIWACFLLMVMCDDLTRHEWFGAPFIFVFKNASHPKSKSLFFCLESWARCSTTDLVFIFHVQLSTYYCDRSSISM